jgi:caffeoyl-CoA O-methyltransferase
MQSHMVTDPLTYFKQWIPAQSELLQQLEKEAIDQSIPIVGPVLAQLMYILARLHRAKSILELGTATGYSTIFLGQVCRHTNGKVISYEINPEFAARARANLNQADLTKFVEIRCENVLDALEELQAPVDMIFMDIEKEDYIRALPQCSRLLRSGGLLLADNTGFQDAHPFNQAIYSDKKWESVNIWSYLPGHSPQNDGILIALKS